MAAETAERRSRSRSRSPPQLSAVVTKENQPLTEVVQLEARAVEEQVKLVESVLSDEVRTRLRGYVEEGLVKPGDFDLQAVSNLATLNKDLQERVLTYIDSNKVYLTHSRSKAGFLVSCCEKARRGALDEKGIGAVDPWRDYLLSIARPRPRQIELVPELEWLQRCPGAQEFLLDVQADPDVGVSVIRVSLQLFHSVLSVKEKLADIGVNIPVQKMRLKEATVGFLRDERTLAFYNLSSGMRLQLVPKRRGGVTRRGDPTEDF
eukprot:gb/GFBE01005681.1/.p1 GENE.gb/GFBE01005681.1/~~gb/GFBE01005681.1/.p1  ORF type:complete len:263 (+),score=48.20 gb/GFBE01005681.1/:1-789(+)